MSIEDHWTHIEMSTLTHALEMDMQKQLLHSFLEDTVYAIVGRVNDEVELEVDTGVQSPIQSSIRELIKL